MIPFIIVKTRAGFSYVRPEHVLAVNAGEPGECAILLTHGVTIIASEPAEDVIARIEAEARDEAEAQRNKEHSPHGHVAR